MNVLFASISMRIIMLLIRPVLINFCCHITCIEMIILCITNFVMVKPAIKVFT